MQKQSLWGISSFSKLTGGKLWNLKHFEVVRMLDFYSRNHSIRVKDISIELGWLMGIKEERLIKLGIAALLHDIGKIVIDKSILTKKHSLSYKEYQLIKLHPELGEMIWNKLNGDRFISQVIVSHHEHYDGNGYPFGLSGDAIPIEGRIIAVADALDAMMSYRSYRRSLTFERAISVLQEGCGNQFDPDVVQAILRIPEIINVHNFRGTANPMHGNKNKNQKYLTKTFQ